MKKTNLQKGFTLIELLVVIAIIGILSSVVLASLSTARNKSKDAAIKSELASLRTQIEVAANGGSYAAAFTGGNTWASADAQTQTILTGITTGGSVTTLAGSNATAWAASASLPGGGFACVDSTGKIGTATLAAAGSTVCP